VFLRNLAPEIAFPGIGDEKRSNGPIRVVGAKVAMAAVESGDDPIGTNGLQDLSARARVAQSLCQFQVLAPGYISELLAVLGVVLVKLVF